jgi:hypothetical protein
MSCISFVRVDTREVVGSAPMQDWWMVTGELMGVVAELKDVETRTKLQRLLALGKDFRQPPCRVILTEMDIVDWYSRTSLVMIRLLKQVAQDMDAYTRSKSADNIDVSMLWSHKASSAFVELLALNSALLEVNGPVIAREIRTPVLKVI